MHESAKFVSLKKFKCTAICKSEKYATAWLSNLRNLPQAAEHCTQTHYVHCRCWSLSCSFGDWVTSIVSLFICVLFCFVLGSDIKRLLSCWLNQKQMSPSRETLVAEPSTLVPSQVSIRSKTPPWVWRNTHGSEMWVWHVLFNCHWQKCDWFQTNIHSIISVFAPQVILTLCVS